MELLHSRAIPGPEFVSLSILLRSDISGYDAAPISCHLGGGGEPILLSGPLSTISQSSCKEALTELHLYINSIFKASSSNKTNANSKDTATNSRFLQEDEKFLFGSSRNSNARNNNFVTQIFRPQKCHGIALQYHLVRDRKQLSSFLVPLILNSSKVGSGSTAGIDMKEVTGVVICVGMGGGPVAAFGVGTSSLTYSLSHRMKKALGILCSETTTTSISNNKKRNVTSPATMDLNLARSLLTTLLLTDDEDRMVNSLVSGEQRVDISQEDQFTKRVLTMGSKKKSSQSDIGTGGDDDENPLAQNSADQGRAIVERMAVLSVNNSDSMLRKYERRQAAKEAAATGKSSKKRLRKLAKDADLDGFDFRGEKRSISLSYIDVGTSNINNKGGGDDVSVSAGSTFTSATLKGPKKDTASKSSNNRSRVQNQNPGLLAKRLANPPPIAFNSKDSTANNRSRKLSVDLSIGGRARNVVGRRSKSMKDGVGGSNQADFQNSFSMDHNMDSFEGGINFESGAQSPQGSVGSRTFSAPSPRQQFDPFSESRGHSNEAFSPEAFGRKDISMDLPGGSGTSVKALVNVALNEDLTCFYKLSKLSSCSVEGVVQVQVRSNVDRMVPFSLLIKDPSGYIQTIQENKMFAKSVADKTKKSDFAFAVSVPKAEEYFPVMRYKCGDDLRPVPIRVQTRVRLEDSHWRVALQISSNPHNDDSLTDLTIIMGVPPEVDGESLTTSPPGGVWNASKRSVIWCVSELGGGEKFQLQARFEIASNSPTDFDDDEKPKFPVLVRCQCMYAQLSDIEIDVRSALLAMPDDVKMKLARRFRLSHRERP